jgi:hypothetical protein
MRKWTSRDRLESGRLPGQRCLTRFAVLSRGGYWSGSILSHRRLVTEAGPAAKARTLAIEYRLAPEQPFPAALDDALSAWRFLGKKGIAAGQMPMWPADRRSRTPANSSAASYFLAGTAAYASAFSAALPAYFAWLPNSCSMRSS